MTRNYISILLLCFALVTVASATDGITAQFYGNVVYNDTTPVLAGSEIVAITHAGNEVGKITMVTDGVYGSAMFNGRKMVVTANYSDYLYFYVDGVRSPDKFILTSNGDLNHDIVVPVTLPVPPVPTVGAPPTVETTPELVTVNTTTEVTTEVTTEGTMNGSVVETPIITQSPSLLNEDIEGVEVWVLGGVIGTFAIIILVFLALAYVTRDDNEGNTLSTTHD